MTSTYSNERVAVNNWRGDVTANTTAANADLGPVTDGSLSHFSEVVLTNDAGSDVYFRLNGPTADTTNGELIPVGETKTLVGAIKSISVVTASGTCTLRIEGRG